MSLHLITGYAGEEHITSSDHASFNIAMFGGGEFVLDRGNKFEASVISNNLIRILDGDLMIQGRHVRLKENTYEELAIENGSQGKYRNDLIVARYSKKSVTGIEQCEFVVIKGEESSTQAVDPAYTTGDITEQGNALITEFPLYRIRLDGLNVKEPEVLFNLKKSMQTQIDDGLGEIKNWIPAVPTYTANRCYYVRTKNTLKVWFSLTSNVEINSSDAPMVICDDIANTFGVNSHLIAWNIILGLNQSGTTRKLYKTSVTAKSNILVIETTGEVLPVNTTFYGFIEFGIS